MKGYDNNSEATAEVFRGGWIHTGDLAYADGDGYLLIVDRKKDLIIRGGYKVYPREVEKVLFAHACGRRGRRHRQAGREARRGGSRVRGAQA